MPKTTVRGVEYDTVEVWLGPDGAEALYGVGTYPRNSVLAGEESFTWLGDYAEFADEFPGLGGNGRGRPPVPQMSNDAPSWFNAGDAGERRGDDY